MAYRGFPRGKDINLYGGRIERFFLAGLAGAGSGAVCKVPFIIARTSVRGPGVVSAEALHDGPLGPPDVGPVRTDSVNTSGQFSIASAFWPIHRL